MGLQAALHDLDRSHNIRLIDGAQVADPEDLASQLSLPFANHQAEIAPGLEDRLRLVADQRLREVHRGHRRRCNLRRGQQAQSQRVRRGPECRGHPQVPLKNGGQALLPHHDERLAQTKEDADRGSGEGHALRLHLLCPLPVEIETRRAGARLTLPGGLADAQHGDTRWEHPSLLRRRDCDVDAPRIDRQRNRADGADAVDDQQPVVALDHRGQCLQRIGHAGRGLVVGDQHGGDVRLAAQ